MATYTVASGDVGVGPWTLTASQVDTVEFADNIGHVRIVSDGAEDAYVTIDGATPTVPTAGASTRSLRLPAGGVSVLEVSVGGNSDAVKIVSAGTPKVSVEKAL